MSISEMARTTSGTGRATADGVDRSQDGFPPTRNAIGWSTMQEAEVLAGADVFGANGEKVGTVAAVNPGYIVVEKGFFFPTDYYIPRGAIASYDGDRVYLSVSKDAALGRGWDAAPSDLETASVGTTTETVDTYAETDRVAAARVAGDEEIRIPVMEEELTATVRAREAGVVRIEKDVVTEERVLDVPVTEERVRVERRVVDRPADTTDIGAFEETVIDVPLRTETVDLQKQARVAEEVVVSKDAVQRTEQVRGTVRREEVTVDEDAVVDPAFFKGSERDDPRR